MIRVPSKVPVGQYDKERWDLRSSIQNWYDFKPENHDDPLMLSLSVGEDE